MINRKRVIAAIIAAAVTTMTLCACDVNIYIGSNPEEPRGEVIDMDDPNEGLGDLIEEDEAQPETEDAADVTRGFIDESEYDALIDPEDVMFFVKVEAKDGGVNLRSGPTTDDEILEKKIKNDTVLPVIDGITYEETGKDWYLTVHNGIEGWIAESEVRRIDEEDVYPEDIMFFVEINSKDGSANIREEDGTESDILFEKVKNGTILICLDGVTREDNGKDWLNVVYEGETGWISSSQIKYLDYDSDIYY